MLSFKTLAIPLFATPIKLFTVESIALPMCFTQLGCDTSSGAGHTRCQTLGEMFPVTKAAVTLIEQLGTCPQSNRGGCSSRVCALLFWSQRAARSHNLREYVNRASHRRDIFVIHSDKNAETSFDVPYQIRRHSDSLVRASKISFAPMR